MGQQQEFAATESDNVITVKTVMDISEVAERAAAFATTLAETRARLAPEDFWYPYGSLGNFPVLDALLTGEHRNLSDLADGKPIVDIGGADGDCSFFLETLGYQVQLIDNPPTNFNGLKAARMLKEALSSSVEIFEVDLDAQFSLPETEYGVAFMLGLLYHLKNPYYVLETLARRTHYCLISTRVARFSPDGVDLGDIPVAYLVDDYELNNDPTNFWVFSHAGLRRLLSRTGWEICADIYIGNTAECGWGPLRGGESAPTFRSDPASLEKDERAFLLIRSKGLRTAE
jgi:tRNA (mo5U34)-methyltransferase